MHQIRSHSLIFKALLLIGGKWKWEKSKRRGRKKGRKREKEKEKAEEKGQKQEDG